MGELTTAITIMTGLAVALAGVLAFAYRFLRVEEDPRLEKVTGMLPGSNCGACGEPGCAGLAAKIVAGGAKPGKCTVSPPEKIQAIADFMGVAAGFEERRVARLHCAGGKGSVKDRAAYKGIGACKTAVVVNGGGRACAWGCLGLADCAVACTFDAIHMNSENLPLVDVDKCTACNDCVVACPLNLFTIEPLLQKLVVQCSSPLAGEKARAICRVTCDACGRCATDSKPGVVEMVNGLPVIRKPLETAIQATLRCPTGAIQWVEGAQVLSPEQENLLRSAHG